MTVSDNRRSPGEGSATLAEGAGSLAGQVAAHIRRHIASNRLGPGDTLPGEAEISRQLKVSRPVVREAWNGLAALGLLEVAPGRKPKVARLIGLPMRSVIEQAVTTGQATPLQVLELRRGIEVQMVGLAAERRDEPTLSAMEGTVAAMAQCLADHGRYAELDARLHLQIARGACNPLHLLLVEACTDAFRGSMRAGLASRVAATEFRRLQTNHEEIVEAVRDRKAARAISLMEVHFDDAMEALMRSRHAVRG